MRLFSAVVLLCALLLTPAYAQRPAEISADSCFYGLSPGGIYPIVVSVKNPGASADGLIQVGSESYTENLDRQRYPVSLPGGTVKRLVVYPSLPSYTSQINVSFQGSTRIRPVTLRVEREAAGANVGLIGDEIGGMTALRKQQNDESHIASDGFTRLQNVAPYSDCYARPEDAPDRAIGYQALRVLLLSNGAERLNAAQWVAIRRWVEGGGALVLLGGAAAPYLQLPEAQPLVPLQNLVSVSVPDLKMPAAEKTIAFGRAALLTGPLKPGAVALQKQGEQPLVAALPLGAGIVVYAAFNPLEKPFRGHAAQADLLIRLIHAAAPTARPRFLPDEETNIYPPGRGINTTFDNQNNDPFRIQLPPVKTIQWYFIGYFALVVPVTYLVLKLIRRLQWAWITGPLVSVAFAYGLYLFTASLYQAGMSRRTYGTLVGAAGESEARFIGYSELFLPRAGNYPLQIPGAEILRLRDMETESSYYTGYSGRRGGSDNVTEPLETVDTGTVESPEFPVGNLAFRRIYHAQTVPLAGTITAQIRRDAGGKLTGTLRNGTAWELQNVMLRLTGKDSLFRATLKPGETVALDALAPMHAQSDNANPMRLNKQQSGCVFLTAILSGEPFGPALGRYVGSEKAVRLLVSLPVTGGRP